MFMLFGVWVITSPVFTAAAEWGNFKILLLVVLFDYAEIFKMMKLEY